MHLLATFTLGGIVSWTTENWSSIAASLGLIVAAASVLIKALEALVALLVQLFPELKTIDGELKGAAAWLDAVATSGPLTKLSLAPKSPVAPAPPAKAAGFVDIQFMVGLPVIVSLIAMVVMAFGGTGCAQLKPLPSQSVSCAAPLPAEAVSLLPEIESALASKDFLPLIISAAGDLLPVARCIVDAMVVDLEAKAAAAPDWAHAAPLVLKLTHAHAFMAATAGR